MTPKQAGAVYRRAAEGVCNGKCNDRRRLRINWQQFHEMRDALEAIRFANDRAVSEWEERNCVPLILLLMAEMVEDGTIKIRV